jgi:hypothetical protein
LQAERASEPVASRMVRSFFIVSLPEAGAIQGARLREPNAGGEASFRRRAGA